MFKLFLLSSNLWRAAVEFFMAGLATGVSMFPGCGGYQTTTLASDCTTKTYATTSYYTEASKYYTTNAPDY